ncbi:MAG: hypothetical protein ACYCS8_12230 [Acidithiobacillus sp.]
MVTLSEHRRAQLREAARTFRKSQEEKGLYQCTLWLTHRQAHAVREWLYRGGDISVFSQRGGHDHEHGNEN